jgi:surface antigen
MLGKIMATAATAVFVIGASSAAQAQGRYADCGGSSNRNQEAAGAIAGAIIGGVIGNQVFKGERGLGTVAGVVLGGVAGAQLAKSGDDCDQYYASNAYYDAFENNDPHERVSWRNPRSGNYGYVEPAEYYQDRRGRQCRAYEQEIYVNGRRQIAEGVACRNRDGTWRIIE